MKKTEHLGLNLWELSDRVRMEDFNADNLKIDERLHASGELILKETIEGEKVYKHVVDISGIQWERYMMVAVMLQTKENNGFLLDMRGYNERATYIDMSTAKESPLLIETTSHICHLEYINHMTMLIPVFYNRDRMLTAISFGSGTYETPDRIFHAGACFGGATKLLKDYTELEVSAPHILTHTTGDQIEIWGVR